MIFLRKDTDEKYDFPVKESGREERFRCPVCSEQSKRKNPLDVSINGEVGHCHKCESVFYKYKKMDKKQYVKPEWKNNTDLSDAIVKWFEERKINQATLRIMKITEGKEYMPQVREERNTIQFNYFQDGQLVNIKYRDGEKNFKLYSGAKLILYNLDAIKDNDKVIITEGEMDCLSFVNAAISYAVSVPNGANRKTQNLEYIDNCIEYFDNKKIIYLATDADDAGVALRSELLRRFGTTKCRKITFEDCKDANEYLVKYGGERLRERVEQAEEFPIEGVFRVKDFAEDFNYYYEHGLSSGVRIMHENLNERIRWETARLAVITGIPGYGKSEAVDEITTQLNICHGWKGAYFSPENFPLSYHAAKLAEKLIGKRYSKDGMSLSEKAMVVEYIQENFFFISPENEDYKLETILQRAQDLIYRYGIRFLVIDPWNRIEHQIERGLNESTYVGRVLTKLTNFAQRNDILMMLVAHPRKMDKNPVGEFNVPNLYDVSGSANFFNQCDYGLCIHQRNRGRSRFEYIEIHVQKVKFKFLGSPGLTTFVYNKINGRFSPCDIDESEGVGRPKNYQEDNRNFLIKEPGQGEFWEAVKPIDNIPF